MVMTPELWVSSCVCSLRCLKKVIPFFALSNVNHSPIPTDLTLLSLSVSFDVLFKERNREKEKRSLFWGPIERRGCFCSLLMIHLKLRLLRYMWRKRTPTQYQKVENHRQFYYLWVFCRLLLLLSLTYHHKHHSFNKLYLYFI